MVTKTVEVRNGLKVNFNVPSTVDEYNKLANRGDNACLDDAVDNNIYRAGLPDFWDKLSEALEAQFNIKKLTKPHPDAKKAEKGETVVAETNPAYVDRVAAEQGVEPTKFQSIVDGFGTIDLDLTERKGKGGGALVGKGDLDMAKTYMDAGPEKLHKALTKIAKVTGDPIVELTGDNEKDQRSIALAIKAFRAAAAKNLLS